MAEKASLSSRANRAWRLVATGLGFVFFGVFGVLLQLFLIPFLLNPSPDLASRKRARRTVTKTWLWFSHYLTADVVLLLSRVPEANCIVKADLLKNPAMIGQIRSCGYLPNHEDMDFVEAVDKILQEECLLVFPEGTRTGWDGVVKFHRGAVSMGLRSAKTITPVVIRMQPPNFKKGQPWYKIPLQKPVYVFRVGDDIDPQDWLAKHPLPIAARRLNDYLQHYFNERSKND